MAIELNINKAAVTVAGDTKLFEDQGAAQGAKLGTVLGGENVKVTSGAMTDLEKLVAQLKSENEDAKLSVSQRRISILQTVLDSMRDRITQAERESLVKIEELNGEKAGAETELAGLQRDKASTEGRIAELDMKIAELEKAVARAVQDGEDHREQVEKLKAQRAEEREKLDRIDTAIESANAKIAGIDVKIAECTNTIAATTLNEVASALRAAARDAGSSPSAEETGDERNADRVERDRKEEAADIGNVIRESLDKIEGQIRALLDEAQMKDKPGNLKPANRKRRTENAEDRHGKDSRGRQEPHPGPVNAQAAEGRD